ncbi:MAG TPA: hypothetical protein V6C72_12440 [Chroococcales cyanobacterium]
MGKKDGPPYLPGQLLAAVRSGVSEQQLQASLAKVNGSLLKRIGSPTRTFVLIEVSNDKLQASLQALSADPNFESVQLNYVSRIV